LHSGNVGLASSRCKSRDPSPVAEYDRVMMGGVAIDHNVSGRQDGETPYSLNATEAFQLVFRGGKPDDITVLVALIE
jgi:hypothetical protein